ncbi:glycerate kinase family protein [Nocardioides bizhenqiangii]|uniref:Glycerate kinase n=1 Tax=Nocardioides bizhenqiangii TaxID=3095076 RepID=A0ABZ0ZM11_9ACTN|nr:MULTISPECIES: glycerate kinase [unclassified Nocardioides]MDZ5620734.1 glycerate kinase [Nocardioides sp. HM23]WQQ25095.1 glycerate kinase [Nocardioides sp. HM61]
MRILVAPDKFAGTLSAVEAAEAIAEGWRRQAPGDEIDLAPMSDGGPGFVDVLNAALGGELLVESVAGPFGDTVPATVLIVGDTAYIESAQACGVHLTGGERAEHAGTAGVGELIAAAIDAGARAVVVGLGGSGTNDAGAGMLGALGAAADVPLDKGASGVNGARHVDLEPARRRTTAARLVAATDVDSPLTGLFGATRTFGAQKGIAEERMPFVDGLLESFAAITDFRTSLEKGAGAAGGLGFGLFLLGAERQAGIELVARAVGLADRARQADLVITGEGAFDFSSRAGKVPAGVAAVASEALRPCIALAGQVLVGSRETRALGMDAAYSIVDLVGEEEAFRDPGGALALLTERVARTWSD